MAHSSALPGARPVRAPRGTEISAKSWQTEAPLRMLMNNLDPEVAERPDDLVVYGGTGRAARSWEAFDAIVETLNFAFPTIITSGSILSICGFLIGSMTSEPVIAGIGESLGRGTVISIIMVMFALPQILLIGSKVIDRTSFAVPNVIHRHAADGRIRLDGVVHGEIHGTVSGVVRAIVDGDVNVTVISGSMVEEGGADDETE